MLFEVSNLEVKNNRISTNSKANEHSPFCRLNFWFICFGLWNCLDRSFAFIWWINNPHAILLRRLKYYQLKNDVGTIQTKIYWVRLASRTVSVTCGASSCVKSRYFPSLDQRIRCGKRTHFFIWIFYGVSASPSKCRYQRANTIQFFIQRFTLTV